MKFTVPVKKAKAPWTTAFPSQAKALRPENGPAGGVKQRSQPEAVRMAVYVPIAEMYKFMHPRCEICPLRAEDPHCYALPTVDIHHSRGRDGLLLFDTRWFKAACRPCHEWAERNPKAAAAVGVTDLKYWRKEQV